MSAQEIIEILNRDGEVIGTMPRGEAEDAGHVIPNCLVFIFDSAGRVWVQLRPQSKKHFPGLWDISACGGVIHGEAPDEAARREQFEEMGFQATLTYVETFMNVLTDAAGVTYHRLSHLYIGVSDQQPRTNEEVDAFQAFPYPELRAEVAKHPDRYIPSFLTELDRAVAAYLAR